MPTINTHLVTAQKKKKPNPINRKESKNIQHLHTTDPVNIRTTNKLQISERVHFCSGVHTSQECQVLAKSNLPAKNVKR